MQTIAWRKKPRSGQQRVFDALARHQNSLNVKVPTAYGKTFICAGVYSILQKQLRVNRLLVIFPTDYQLEQFYRDGHTEFWDACIDGPHKVIDVRFSGIIALKEHRANTAQIFAITVQSLLEKRGMDNCTELMQTGQWMVCVDEYHHYGIDKCWGKCVSQLSRAFLLAMSATPSRPNDDSAFGVPDISMSYVEAEKESSVKPLRGHAYNFRLDVLLEDGTEQSYTADEFYGMAGTDDPDALEKFRIERKMRWSPKYISPLISVPIERMLRDRIATGFRLQALIFSMCVSHAEFVCEQIKAAFPELVVDWVGTGENGRSKETNKEILAKFCPPKNERGDRAAIEIDVLVNVGMAGEGLDSIAVSEVVFLKNASLSNKTIQEKGRASRYLPDVTGNINFDASSELAKKKYVGAAIMDAMDLAPPTQKEGESEPRKHDELPDEPFVRIYNVELIDIDSGDAGVQRMAKVAAELGGLGTVDYKILSKNLEHPGWEAVKVLYRAHQAREAQEFNEKSIIRQWRDSVESAASVLTGRVISLHLQVNGSMEKKAVQAIRGKVKTAINGRKKRFLGKVDNDLPLLKSHYHWCKQLDKELTATGIPEWLKSALIPDP